MARTGKVTLYEGIGKASKKPYTALKVEIGEFTKLVFLDSKFELDYIKKYLSEPETSAEVTERANDSEQGIL